MRFSLFTLNDIFVCLIYNIWDLISIVRRRRPRDERMLLLDFFLYLDEICRCLFSFNLVSRMNRPQRTFGNLLSSFDLGSLLNQCLWSVLFKRRCISTMQATIFPLTHFTRMIHIIAHLRIVLNLMHSKDWTMIDDVTVLSEGSELRRVFFDSAQPWDTKIFLRG